MYGQNDSIKIAAIDKYVNQIDLPQVKVDSFAFIIDSILVDGINYGNTIVTKSLFKESNTTLTTTFYSKGKKMIFAKVVEPSPSKGFEKMYRYCAFYFENNIVISERCRTTRQIGVAINVDGSNANIYGYNESLTFDFLKKYVAILYDRIVKLPLTWGFVQLGRDQQTFSSGSLCNIGYGVDRQLIGNNFQFVNSVY